MSPTTTSATPAELTDQVLQVLERASQPLTLAQVQRGLPRPSQERTEEIRQCLQDLAGQGRIHEFAPYRSKTPRFWTHAPEQHARAVIVEVLQEQAATQRELFLKIRRRLQGFSDARLREMLGQMLLDGQVRKLPPRLGGTSHLLSTREPQARDYLEPAFRTFFDTLREVSKRLEAEGVNRETFVQEAEGLWRELPWDRLSEPPEPRRRSARPPTGIPVESVEQSVPSQPQPPFEPAAAASHEHLSMTEAPPETAAPQAAEIPPGP